MIDSLINQPAGLGDIIFCQKIAKLLKTKYNHTVIWPVVKDLEYVKDYLDFDGFTINNPLWPTNRINLAIADRIFGGSVLKAKYELVRLDWRDWKDYVGLKRNHEKEQSLYNKLNPNNEEYIIVSKLIGTPPGQREIPMKINSNKKIIEVSLIEGYNPFDWCLLLENASEIHMVDTSFNYIMELINVKTKNLHLYSRFYPNTDFSHIEGLFSLPWEYHTHI